VGRKGAESAKTDDRTAGRDVALFRHGVIADLLRTPPGRPQRAPSTLYRRMGNSGPTKRSAEPSENMQDRRHQILSECPPRR